MSDKLDDLRPTADFFGLVGTAPVEKDFHVVRAIAALTAIDASPFTLVFAGGTALARAHRLVRRMSEDVDFKIVPKAAAPVSRSGLRHQLSALRDRVTEALQRAGFAFDAKDPAQTRSRNENSYTIYQLPYGSVTETGQGLRPTIQVELTHAPLRRAPVMLPVTSFVAEARKSPPEVPAVACVGVVETAAEKLVSLTRRTAMDLAGASRDPDPALVRHIYDLHMVREHLDLAAFTPELEIYSIDEAFLNLAGFEHRGLTDYARMIRAEVKQATGIPVSIGIGVTKTLAKIANRLAKKTPASGGVWNLLDAANHEDHLARVAVGDIWGIGRQWSAWLEQQGIKTALDLKRADAKQVRAKMTVVGERIVRELNGVSCLPLELLPAIQKGITVSRSFGKLLSDKDEIRQALLRYVGRAGEKLRRGGLMAERITVFARTDRFNPSRPCYSRMLTTTLPFPTDYTPALIAPALRLFDAIWKQGLGFQKCGVMLTVLSRADRSRRDLFAAQDPVRQARLMKALDGLNASFGARTVHFGDLGGHKPESGMRSNFKSDRFTTVWEELRVVR